MPEARPTGRHRILRVIGLPFYATLSLLGLSAILIEYQWLAWLVRILGSCYLAYLGLTLLLTKPSDLAISGEQAKPGAILSPSGWL